VLGCGEQQRAQEEEGLRRRLRWLTMALALAYVAPTAVLCGDVRVGPSMFPGARIGADVEVRINAVVHVNTEVPTGVTVPIGWVAVGAPAQLFPPGDHEGIWAIQEQLDFPETVYGLPRDHEAAERMARQTAWFGAHRDDETVPGDRAG
jgi:gamma-carbonic anhydrase